MSIADRHSCDDDGDETFETDPDFCKSCGSILLPTSGQEGVRSDKCMVCLAPVTRKEITETTYIVHFHDKDVYTKGTSGAGTGDGKKSKRKKAKDKEQAEGPLVDRDCRECGHKQMSYATLQLRSADEGQTVFYTCPKCKFKESENS